MDWTISFEELKRNEDRTLAVHGNPAESGAHRHRRITAAAINATVKLRCATHYYCTSGGCGNPLCAICLPFGNGSAHRERGKENKTAAEIIIRKFFIYSEKY